MNEPGCPYLVRETITYRESLDLSREAATKVVVTWHCRHPFHGIRLGLGDSIVEIRELCAACTLPPAEDEPGMRGSRHLRRDAGTD
jgi:hypothetical protein